jgi:creatinine amidohydrolase
MRWAELNSRQIANLSRETICLLPIGAIEQHGPHLPVATDRIIAEAIAEKLDAACDDKLFMMPTLSVTCSEHHMAFAGTLSLSHEVFQQIVLQTIGSAAKHGFYRFFLLNAHGGNMAIGGVVAERLSSELPDCEVVFATWFRAAAEQLRSLVEGDYPSVGHACEFETSMVMAVCPELVDRDAIVDDGFVADSPLLYADLLSGAPAVRAIPFDKLTKHGVWGKPSLASSEKGRAIFAIVVPVIQELLAAHWPNAPGVAATANTSAAMPGAGGDSSTAGRQRRAAR